MPTADPDLDEDAPTSSPPATGGTVADRPLPGVPELLDAAVEALGGTPRAGQQQMAQEVRGALATRSHLLVQAGTGTGKSLGYLVPLLRHAVEVGRPVVVSTATLALQHQVARRDLPRVAPALAPLLGRAPTWQILKGRSNYVCLHRVDGGFPEEDALFGLPELPGTTVTSPTAGSALGQQVVRVREWAASTDTGDRDDLVPGVSERAWRQVSVSARECLGAQKCPQAKDCFAERARARAHEADVVVTNHALLAIDAFNGRGILPEHDVLVVDEAHELSDRVTAAISAELAAGAVAVAASRADGCPDVDGGDLEAAGDLLAATLDDVPEGRLRALPPAVQSAVEHVRDAARQVLSALQQSQSGSGTSGRTDDGAGAARQLARAAVSDVFDVAERLAAGDQRDVRWLSQTRTASGAPRRSLWVAPLSVGGLLRETFFEGRTVVLTSATLTIGGTFDAAAGQLGLRPGGAAPRHDSAPDTTAPGTSASDGASDDPPVDGPGQDGAGRGETCTGDVLPWRGVDVASPFDYSRQAMLYVARHLPPPGRDGLGEELLDELAALVTAAGGRTLGLFSSRRAAEAAAAAMRDRLDVEVLCQGDDTMAALVGRFAAEPRTCLFGTLSLWQGVDVPGPSCQLVVIDRLPFPRPDDPLSSARQEAVSRAGGNGFLSVAAHHAALRLAQGAGRLVRATTDRGVVAVLDPRLATARYAGYLMASLPPLWRTTDPGTVHGALRRLDEAAPPVT